MTASESQREPEDQHESKDQRASESQREPGELEGQREPAELERQREQYFTLIGNREAPFISIRPALFSPAAAAQEQANVKGAFGAFGPLFLPLEYDNGWLAESSAHVRSCYLGDWSSLSKIVIRGSGAHAFLAWLGMNDLSTFDVGQVKHHVQLDDNAWVASEGILCRLAEDEFLYTAGSGDWLLWQASQQDWDVEVEDITPDRFIFGAQGPNSIRLLEQVTHRSLRGLAFNRSEEAEIDGVRVRLLRTGISGELGYEIHGSAPYADAVWSTITEAGQGHGLELLGLRSQPVQHIEAGIATNGLDYLPSSIVTPGAPRQFKRGVIAGSFIPSAITDYFRRPDELGWGLNSPTNRDFLGREALINARAQARRVLVGLRWDPEQVLRVYTSLFGDGEPIEQMEIPRRQGPAFDRVLVSDADVGVSTGRTISTNLRAMISLCVIAPEHSEPGTEVSVVWGKHGSPQLPIRASVTSLPFKPDNRRVDVRTLP